MKQPPETIKNPCLAPPREVDSHSATQEIPCLVWNPKVHHHVHRSPPLNPILGHLYPFHTIVPRFFMIYFNILPYTFIFSGQNFVCIS